MAFIESCAPIRDFTALLFMTINAESFEPAIVDNCKYLCPDVVLEMRLRSCQQGAKMLEFCKALLKNFRAIYLMDIFDALIVPGDEVFTVPDYW